MTETGAERWKQPDITESRSSAARALQLEAWNDARLLWRKYTANISEEATLDFTTGEVIVNQTYGDETIPPGEVGKVAGGVTREKPPQIYQTKQGDTVQLIVEKLLPDGSTAEAINEYTRALRLVNNLGTDALATGKKLYLPTIKDDGSISYRDANGNAITLLPDGSQKIKNQAGAGYTEFENRAGDIEQSYSGDGLNQGFRVVIFKGDKHFYSSDGKVFFKPSDNPEISSAHEALLKLAKTEITDPIRLAKFEADLCQFEYRTGLAHLPDSQIADTYKQLERILKSNATKNLTQDQLNDIALQIASNAASPTSIDQGAHPTCNVTTIESCVYTTEPSTAAKLVADVALTSTFVSKDGVVVTIDETPHDSAKSYWIKDGQRNHASEIFQMTAVNLYYQQHHGGTIRYELVDGLPTELIGGKSQTDQLIDYSKPTPKKLDDSPSLSCPEIALIYGAIASDSSKITVLEQRSNFSDQTPGLQYFESESELMDSLRAAKSEGRLPVILSVDARNEPFFTDQNLATLPWQGRHVITITNITDGTPPLVSIDNQWGTAKDHPDDNPIELHTLYLSTFPSASKELAILLRQDVRDQQALGVFDVSKELQALLHERAAGILKDTEYLENLKQLLTRFEALNPTNCAKSNDINQCKTENGQLLDRAIACLPAHLSLSLLQFEKEEGWLNQDEYEDQLVRWGKKFKKEEVARTSADGEGAVSNIRPGSGPSNDLGNEVFDSILAKLPEAVLRRIIAGIDEPSHFPGLQMVSIGS